MSESKTILVAGGAGFIGANLCRRLLSEGQRVVCVDNLSSGRKANLEGIFSNTQFTFLKHDVCDPLQLHVEEVYNLACPASPPFYQKDPIQTMKSNVVGTLNLLELARACGAKFLQASTSEVYGDPLVHPQIEDYRGNVNPIGIRACYDEGKRAAEALCMDYQRSLGVDVKVVRIFNTYGPWMSADDGRVVSNFINQALNDEDLTIFGNGTQTRSLCYVDDLLEGIVRMMNSNSVGPVNFGNPEETTIREFAERVIRLAKSKSGITYRGLPPDDPKRRQPDISLAWKLLEWKPRTGIDEGIAKTISYFRSTTSDAHGVRE